MNLIDEARKNFNDFKSDIDQFIKEDLNESDTRSKIIDALLINVLGWDEKDIKREGYLDSGYFDYKISLPGLYFLVEAKRQFKELLLPINQKKASIKAIYNDNKEVINQIRSYALDSSIHYGLITNGKQIIIYSLWRGSYFRAF